MAERARISVAGIVQGVGFRPYVHALACRLGIAGFVTNTADGVLIEAEGDRLAEFLERLPAEAPPLSRISGLNVALLPPLGVGGFTIRASIDTPGSFTLVPPDVALCADCLRELLDPADRRYRYPFINCTNCGPRYSITRSVPYDRPNTTMAAFTQCPDCEREYHDPRDRRFHAQPNACPKCGPTIEFRVPRAAAGSRGSEALADCIGMLQRGGIVAVKGLGGFHLACDASNDAAVRTLRERKRRSNKPFAVMAAGTGTVRAFCELSAAEEQVLTSPRRPIVLLRKAPRPALPLSEAVAPGNRSLGCMLPYTPLHVLLFQPVADGPALQALVMTSGNLSEEPLVHTNTGAREKLSAIADAFLLHDRDIFMRVDDSVVQVAADERQGAGRGSEGPAGGGPGPVPEHPPLLFLRRARGYAPDPIALAGSGPEVLGCGADLKNTFTLTRGAFAVPSQHIGDMENYETLRFFEQTLENLQRVYRAAPEAVVHDLHPGYLSSRWAREHAAEKGLPVHALQHHYAHIGSVMAEHGLDGPVIGVACDGTGYGADGGLWGGEFLIAGIDGFDRVGQFREIPLPGGEAAVREPWRTAAGCCSAVYGADAGPVLRALGFAARHGEQALRQVLQVAASRELSPPSSGAGRLFDAVAALMGLCDRNTFEGEAAMALESLVPDGVPDDYPVELAEDNGYTVADFSPLIRAVVDDLLAGRDRRVMAARFHNTVAGVVRQVVLRLRRAHGIGTAALSGGTFQNRYLRERCIAALRGDGMQVYVNGALPPNDACISLGQAYIVRERLRKARGSAAW